MTALRRCPRDNVEPKHSHLVEMSYTPVVRPSVLIAAAVVCSLLMAGCSSGRQPRSLPVRPERSSTTATAGAAASTTHADLPSFEPRHATTTRSSQGSVAKTTGPTTGPTLTSSGASRQHVRNGLIAFSAADPSGGNRVQIFLTDGAGRSPLQLTFDGDNEFPAWSADGRRMVFSSNRSGHFEIYTMNMDGSQQTLVPISTPSDKILPRLSPDETQVAFTGLDGATAHPEIWVASASGANPRRLTSTPPGPPSFTWSNFPRFSPDGTKLLYSSTASGTSQLWVMNGDGTHQRRLTSGFGPDYPDANAPNWSPEGDRIVFWAGHEGLYGDVWTMDAYGTRAVRLTHEPNPTSSDNPFWSPDGQQILFDTNRDQTPELWVMDADGGHPHKLVNVGSANNQFSWQPVFDT